MKAEHSIYGNNGCYLIALSDSNRDYPDYLQWTVPGGNAFGIIQNNAETRLFLEDVLRRFRRDATRLARKELKRTLRQRGEEDAKAGKSLSSVEQIELPMKRGRRGKLTRWMRNEYNAGYARGLKK